jgi:hypothetical protein
MGGGKARGIKEFPGSRRPPLKFGAIPRGDAFLPEAAAIGNRLGLSGANGGYRQSAQK